MEQTELLSPLSELIRSAARAPHIDTTRLIEYFGTVNYATNERVLAEMRDLLDISSEELTLMVTSTGGPTGTAMSFFDTVRLIVRPHLTTIGAGDVDSSGVIIFLTGDTRYITPHTTMLLHPAGRVFEGGKRLTARELSAMAREDTLKDRQYAEVVASRSREQLTARAVMSLMQHHSILTPTQIVAYGLADAILE